MAKAFNLTAQLNIQGPNNLKPVIGKIKSAISSIKTDIKLNIDPSSAKNISQITRQLNALAKASDKANGSVAALNNTLSTLASGFNNAAGSVTSSVNALNNVQKTVKSSKTAIVQTTSALEDFGKASGLAVRRFAAFSTVTGVIYGLTNAITAGYKEFLTFNKEIVKLSQVTGLSVKDLKGVTDEITRLSTNFGVASSDLLSVTSTLAQAGLTASDTRIALEALAKSALAPSFDNIASTTEGAIAAMRQFGIQAGELEGALGSINSVAAAFAVESSDIITAIQRTGGVFASSSKGVSEGTDALNEFIAVFTSIRATTRESAETIATGLRTIFTRVQRGKTIEALKEYGVVLTDLQGKFVGPYEATRRLSEGLSKLDPRDLRFGQIVEELGGFRQIGKVIPLIQEFATAEQALGVAQKGQTSLSKDATIAQQALEIQFTKTRESFLALIRDIGDSTSFKTFTTLALTLTNALISLAGALKPLLPLLLTVASLKIGSALTQFGSGFLKGLGGGKGKGFARGGLVPGSGNSDTVPAMLTPGEFVIRKSAVEAIGTGNLHNMNRYATGGYVKKKLPGAEEALKKQSINYEDISNLKINNAGKGAIRGYMFENYVGNQYGTKSPDQTFPDITNLKGYKKKFGLTKQETGKDIIAAELKYRSGLEPEFNERYNRDNTAVLYAINKNSGGLIQKFLAGGGVKQIAATQGKNIEDVILGFVKALGGIGGVKNYLGLPANDRTLDGALRKGSISKNLEIAISAIDKARQAAEDKGTLKAAAMAKAQQLAIVGLNPLDYSDTLFEKISNTDSTIHVKGLLGQYADEAAYMQQSMGNLIASGARRFQSKAIFGGNKNLAFDFDDTLVSGADIYKPGTNQIDIPGYSDLNRVQQALNGPNVQLTELGQALKSILQSNPDILNQIRILTARPQSNAPLLAAKLQQLGLNIPASKITGVSGSRNKVANLGQNEKLIDDLYATVEAVRKGGGEAFPYAPIKSLNQQEQYAANLAAAEGSALQAILVALGATGGSVQNEDVDFKSGLGPQAASFFGIDPNFPTEVKRTLSPDAIYKAKKEFSNWFATKGMAKGGSVEDTVPAMLTPGEFVINKQSAQRIGYGNLHRMNRAKGFNKGGAVGGVQYFRQGGEALERIGTVQAAAALTSILLPQISAISDSFGKLNNSYLKGFGEALQAGASSALSLSTAFKLYNRGFSKTTRAALLGGVTAGTAIGGGLTGFANQSTTNLLEQNSKAFSEFNKALDDSKNAIDEESKARAAKELEKAFRNLNKTIQDNTDALGANQVIGAIGDSATRLSSNITTISTAFLALRPVLRRTALVGARAGAGFLARSAGKLAAGAVGGIPGVVIAGGLIAYEVYNIAKAFTSATKTAAEDATKFGDALVQVTQQQLKNRLNEPLTVETIGQIRDIRNRTDLNIPQKEIATATGIGTNIFLQKRLRADLGLAENKDIKEYLNEIKDNATALNAFKAKLKKAQEDLAKTFAERFINQNPQSQEAVKGLENLTQEELSNIGLQQMGKEILEMSKSAEIALYQVKPLRTEMLKLAEVSAMLGASIIKLNSDLEKSSNDLQNRIDITLGKAKFTPNTNLQKTLDILSNPKGSATGEFQSALKDVLGTLRVSSKGVTPGVESAISSMEGQLSALQFIEKEAATRLSSFNDLPGLAERSDQDLQKVFEQMIPIGGQVSKEVRDKISLDMAQRVKSVQNQGNAATFDEIVGTAREDLITSNKETLKTLTDVQRARIDAEKKFIEQMNQNLDLLNQSNQNLQKQRTTEAEFNLRMQKMFGRGEPSLQQLNEPFNARLRTLTGGTTDPNEIGRQRRAAQDNFARLMSTRIDPTRFTGKDFETRQKALDDARTNEANKINSFTQALEMLMNNTEGLGNAFDKLAERQEELFKTGENALDIFTTALDPIEFQRKVEAPLNALLRLEANVGTKSQQLRDIATVRGGMDVLAVNDQQRKSFTDLLLERVGLPGLKSTEIPKDAQIQELTKQAEAEKAKILESAKILNGAILGASNILVTGAESIRTDFNKGLASSLLGIVDDINRIRGEVFGKVTSGATNLPKPESGLITSTRNRLIDNIIEEAKGLGVQLNRDMTPDVMANTVRNRQPTLSERILSMGGGIFGGQGLGGNLFETDFGNTRGLMELYLSENNAKINEYIRQLQQFNAEGPQKSSGSGPINQEFYDRASDLIKKFEEEKKQSPSNTDSGQLQQSIIDLTRSVASLQDTINSRQPILDPNTVANLNSVSNNLNNAATSLQKTTVRVDHKYDITQNIDVMGDVELSPETIASIRSDVRKQIENSITVYNKNIQTFG